MAYKVTGVQWAAADRYDIHLLADQSVSLKDLFKVEKIFALDSTTNQPATFAGFPPGVKLRFIGEFLGAPGPAHGVKSVDPTNGTVTAEKTFPATRLFNFQVRAEIFEADGTVFHDAPRIRVHLHKTLVDAWLTPSPLTIHKGADGQRFSILAEFDDGTVGDITRLPGVIWMSSSPNVTLGDQGRLAAAFANREATITAQLPAPWGKSPSAVVKTVPPWSSPLTKTAFSVSRSPGAATIGDVPNFLFIPDGFTQDQDKLFEKTVENLVKELRTNESTNPFLFFKDSINYWRAWIESPEPGCSVLHEVTPVSRLNKTAKEIPLASEPSKDPAAQWRVEQMFDRLGLPVKDDVLKPDEDIVGKLAAKEQDWIALYDPQVDAHLYLEAFQAWLEAGDRRLLNERNTALGIAAGVRPNRDSPQVNQGLRLHPLRTTRAHLDDFLKELTDEEGHKIGSMWGDTTGASRSFVFVLASVPRFAGERTSDIIASSLTGEAEFKVKALGGRAMEIVPPAIPKKISLDVSTTVIHESAHELGNMGDEYAELQEKAADFSPDRLNLQDGSCLVAANLKWLWPRIKKATVLTDVPTKPSAQFRLPVKDGDEKLFGDGEIVEVRARPLVANSDVKTSGPLKIKSRPKGALLVEPIGASDPRTFHKDDLIYVAVRGAATAAHPEGEPVAIVTKAIRDHISSKHRPLNAPRPPAAWSCDPHKPDLHAFQTAKNLPPGFPKQAVTAFVVGAYEGGMHYQCGIYHPTGACMMRTQIIPRPGGTSTEAYQFCHVCRYILVDRLDPTKHGLIERVYANRFPP